MYGHQYDQFYPAQDIYYIIQIKMEYIYGAYQMFSSLATFVASVVVITHLICSFWPKKKVNLNENSLVVITGGCMGIGKYMSFELAKQYHCKILIIDRRDDLFDDCKKQLQALNSKPSFLRCDLSKQEDLDNLIKNVKKQHKKIDLFIYNAGIVIPKTASETSLEENNLVMKINYFTPTYLINQFENLLVGGHIAVVCSIIQLASGALNCSTYGASKAAIYHYISSLRQQYKNQKKNITVSLACPFAINTGMFTGFKMMIEIFVPMLDEKYVSKRLVKEFVERKEICFIYQYASWILRILEMLPSQIYDWAWVNLDQSDFSQIKNRHAGLVKQELKESKKVK